MGSVISSLAMLRKVISCREVIRFGPDFSSCSRASCSVSPFRSRAPAPESMCSYCEGFYMRISPSSA